MWIIAAVPPVRSGMRTPGSIDWFWAWALAIPATTTKAEAAKSFVEWATSKAYVKLVAETGAPVHAQILNVAEREAVLDYAETVVAHYGRLDALLNIAGGFIVVVGYAMVINMMKARKLMPFFFLGFVFATFGTTVTSHSGKVEDQLDKGVDGMANWIVSSTPTAVSLVALGILGACLAVIYVQLNPEFHEAVRLPQPAAAGFSHSGSHLYARQDHDRRCT